MKSQETSAPQGSNVRDDGMVMLQFDQILAAYKVQSKQWKPVLNKFAEGEFLVSFIVYIYCYVAIHGRMR